MQYVLQSTSRTILHANHETMTLGGAWRVWTPFFKSLRLLQHPVFQRLFFTFLWPGYKTSPSRPSSAPNEQRGLSADSGSAGTLCLHHTAAAADSTATRPRAGSGLPVSRARAGSAAAPPAWPRSPQNTVSFLSSTQCSIAPRSPASNASRWSRSQKRLRPLQQTAISHMPAALPAAMANSASLTGRLGPTIGSVIQPRRMRSWRPF